MNKSAKNVMEKLLPYVGRECLLNESGCFYLVRLEHFGVDERPDGRILIEGRASALKDFGLSYSRIRSANKLHEKDTWLNLKSTDWDFAVSHSGVYFMGPSYIQFSYMYGSVRLYFHDESIKLFKAKDMQFLLRFFEWSRDH